MTAGTGCIIGFILTIGSKGETMSDDKKQELTESMKTALKKLTYREREIIKLRYGLGDGYTYTLQEVAHIFKVTRERIRRIEGKAVVKLERMGERIDRP